MHRHAANSRHMFLLSATLLTLAAAACDLSDPCDPGQYEAHGLCWALPVDAGGMDAGADDDAGDNGDPFAGFGTECTMQSECESFDLVCGEGALPYCTRTNCIGNANACPPMWTCFDVTGLSPDPNVTSICLMP